MNKNEKLMLVELLFEAAEIIDSFALYTSKEDWPECYRQPIADELYGYALMLKDENNE